MSPGLDGARRLPQGSSFAAPPSTSPTGVHSRAPKRPSAGRYHPTRSFRPRGFPPPRRLAPPDGSQACCILLPTMGSTGFQCPGHDVAAAPPTPLLRCASLQSLAPLRQPCARHRTPLPPRRLPGTTWCRSARPDLGALLRRSSPWRLGAVADHEPLGALLGFPRPGVHDRRSPILPKQDQRRPCHPASASARGGPKPRHARRVAGGDTCDARRRRRLVASSVRPSAPRPPGGDRILAGCHRSRGLPGPIRTRGAPRGHPDPSPWPRRPKATRPDSPCRGLHRDPPSARPGGRRAGSREGPSALSPSTRAAPCRVRRGARRAGTGHATPKRHAHRARRRLASPGPPKRSHATRDVATRTARGCQRAEAPRPPTGRPSGRRAWTVAPGSRRTPECRPWARLALPGAARDRGPRRPG